LQDRKNVVLNNEEAQMKTTGSEVQIQTLKKIKARKEFYLNIHTLQLILATLPFTTASAERSFNYLKRLKTYLRKNMGEERLFGLAQMQLHPCSGAKSTSPVG